MTASIEDNRRQRALLPPEDGPRHAELTRPIRIVQGAKVLSLVMALTGACALTAGVSTEHWGAALIGATLMIMSAVVSLVWLMNVLLADRETVFHLGELDGWIRGWRGQEPRGTGEPLLRRH